MKSYVQELADFCTSWPFYFFINDKEKIEKTLELIQDFENLGLSKHYKANAQKMGIMLDKIKKTLEE